MINLRVIGMGAAITSLRNKAERVTDAARAQMHRSAAKIVDEAKINVPEDDRLLKNSIRIEKTYGARGRLQIDIVAGGQTVTNPDGRDVELDQYASLVHEDYEGSVAYVNGPSKRTLRKMQAYPGRVGSKFLSRAAEAEEEKLERNTIEAITEITKE